jgi:PAS domain S-box-containing protein
VWLTWWLGDLGGAIVLAPLMLVWAAYPALEWRPVRAAELLIILLGLWMTSHLLFGPWDAVRGIPIMYVTVPWLVWAAYRFGPPETATAICLLSGVAIVGTTHGYGPFASGDPNAALLVLQGFLVVLSPTILALAAGVATDRASQIALKRGHEELELRVEARTRDLEAANAALQLQVKERIEAEDRVRRSEQGLLEAERLAHLGNWSWEVSTNTLYWSEELMRIYGISPDRFKGTVDDFLLRLPAEDRANAERIIEQALRDHRPFDFYHGIIRPDGAQRIVHARGQVVVNQAGKVVRMYGTGQDVTELKRAESALQRANDELERRVTERTRELAATNEQLREKVADLESFEEAVVGRELKMIQLEKELEELKKEKRPSPYPLPGGEG